MSGVRAGDLAIIKAEHRLNGRIVDVVGLAPCGEFSLPDGTRATTEGYDAHPYWIVKFIGGRALFPTDLGIEVFATYGVVTGLWLFPLPGDPVDERETDEVSA
jgi:hypothetical protein